MIIVERRYTSTDGLTQNSFLPFTFAITICAQCPFHLYSSGDGSVTVVGSVDICGTAVRATVYGQTREISGFAEQRS